MAQVFGNRILGGIGAPESRAAETFGAGVNTALGQRTSRLAMDVTAQDMRLREDAAKRVATEFGWKAGDRARSEAAFDAYGAPLPSGGGAAPAPGVNVGGMFAPMGTAPAGYRLGAPGQMPMPGMGAGQDLTFGLTKHFEGYRATPYWDVNAYRGGFGSDTVTMSDGSVVKVKPGMTITEEDAQRDFDRRMNTEFVPRAAKQVGEQVWAAFPAHVVEALASVTYNYGSLPGNVVEAAKTGNPELIAQAIEARAGDNGGINAKRRMQEAAIVRSGGAIDPALMRAAAAPTGVAGGSYIPDQSQRYAPMPRQPDQSQRFNPGDYIDALRGETRFAPDGSIDTAVAPQGRPGDFAAQATQDRISGVTPTAVTLPEPIRTPPPEGYQGPRGPVMRERTTFTSADIPMLRRMKEDLRARRAAETARRANGTPSWFSSEDLNSIVAQEAQIDALIEQVGMIPGDTSLRKATAVEGPGATGTEAVSYEAALAAAKAAAATPATTAPATTAPATTAPATTPAQAGLSFGGIAPTGELPLSLGATGAEPPAAGAAGVAVPSVTTSDVRAGASVTTDTGNFPGLAALFQDTAMVGQEEAALAAQEQALLRRMEFARQTRDATTMMEADGQLALIQARRVTLGHIKAGNAAMSGNFDPMAEVLSGMTGQTVRITPTGTGTYDVSVDGRVAQSDVDPQFMVQQYLYGVNEAYRTQVDAARAARASQAAEQAKYAAEQAKIALEAELKYAGEQTVEEIKGKYSLALAAQNPDLATASITMPDQSTALMVFSKKNPNTPLTIVQFQTNSDGTIEPVQVPVTDLQRNQ